MKILTIGDSCTDVFRYGKVDRLAPEAPVPVIIPQTEKINSGMAGNVVENLKALGAEVDFITNYTQIKKVRYVCSKYNHLLLRVDENDVCENIKLHYDLSLVDMKQYDAVVISDYCKGFLTEEDIEKISILHPLTFLDTKKLLGNWAVNITFIKLNNIEYNNNRKILLDSSLLSSKVVKTRGKYGCDYQGKNYPTVDVPVKDVSGAGDTFLAGMVFAYINSKNIESAIEFAQKCTTVVVQKSGVSTI